MKTLFCGVLSTFLICFNVVALPTRESPQRNANCEACKAFVAFVDKLAKNDSFSLEDALIAICNDYSALPGAQTTNMCKRAIRDVLNLFKNANSETFCDEIGTCDGEVTVTEDVEKANDNQTCQFCIDVVTNLKEIVSGKETELEVKTIVEDWCHYLGSFENECVSLSDEYLDTLFAYIRTALQPNRVCAALGVCPRLSVRKRIEKVADISEVVNIFPAQMPLIPLESARPVNQSSNGVNCLICKRLIALLIQELKDNRTEAAITAALDHICELLPKADRNQCVAFVNEYTDEIIHILTEETDPDLACTLLGVCVPQKLLQFINPELEKEEKADETQNSREWTEIERANEVYSVNESVGDKNKSKLCFECELLMHFIQTELNEYTTEEEIEDFIQNEFCDKMKIVVAKDTCDSFVKQYTPTILQVIAQKVFDPSLVCQNELKLCPKVSNAVEVDIVLNNTSQKCDLCVSLVQQIDALLENEQIDKQLTQIVESVCTELPVSKQEECRAMIDSFGPYFLQMIGHMSDPKKICESIDMCYTGGHTQLLGGHKCTFGPSYWCHTIAHAEACNATHFCRNKVWKAIQ